jgi:hypothetical protein
MVISDYSNLSYDETDTLLPKMIKQGILVNKCPILAFGQSSHVLWQQLGNQLSETASYMEGRRPAYIAYDKSVSHPYRMLIEELCIDHPSNADYLSGHFTYDKGHTDKRPKFITVFGSKYTFDVPNRREGIDVRHLCTSNVNNNHFNDFIVRSDNNPVCIGSLHVPYNAVNLTDSINYRLFKTPIGDYSSILHVYKILSL